MSYVLEDGEVIILRDESAFDAYGKRTSLLLTNINIIKVTYDFWGNGKDRYFPLSQLRESNGTPNILVGKGGDGKNRLELYFEQGQEFFSFKGLMAEKKWASAIAKAYKTRMKEIAKSERESSTSSKFFSPLIEKLDAAKETFSQRERRIVSNKCPFCGAITKGHKGEQVQCAFCESSFVIQ